MAKIKRLILGMIPNQKCNLKCEYCYISQVDAWEEPEPLQYSVEHIRKCLSKERLGGVSLINLTGNGETLLQPDIVPLVRALLEEGHFVEIVTNGTVTRKIEELILMSPELLSRMFFKISFHYKELVRLKLLEKFFDNIRKIHASGASFTLELMAYDGIEDNIDEIYDICMKYVGAVCHGTIGRNDKRKDKALLSKHTKEEFKNIWEQLDSPMIEFKLDMLGVKRREFCYAGNWSLFVNMYTGESQPCYWQPYNQNIFLNSEKKIRFVPVGHTCTQPYCTNAHAHMTWGIIPDIQTPRYEEMRNRIMVNGEEWLSQECKDFFCSKLYESNKVWNWWQRAVHNIIYPFRLCKWFCRDWKNNIHRLKKYVKRLGK
ncbi:MAG: radical SAM protein [Brotaphodocola sp.]